MALALTGEFSRLSFKLLRRGDFFGEVEMDVLYVSDNAVMSIDLTILSMLILLKLAAVFYTFT